MVSKEEDVAKSAEFGIIVNKFGLVVDRMWTMFTSDLGRNITSPFSRTESEGLGRFVARQTTGTGGLMGLIKSIYQYNRLGDGAGTGVPATQTIPAPKSGQTPADAGARGNVAPQTQQIFNDQRRIEIKVDGSKDPRQTAEEVERRLSYRTGASPMFGVMTPGWGAAAVG